MNALPTHSSAAEHERFMRRALELARSVWGATHPNPMVGALIVEDGHVVAEGATAPDGAGRMPSGWRC